MNNVIMIKRNPENPEHDDYIAQIGSGPYLHGRIVIETLWQETGETHDALYVRALRRSYEINNESKVNL